MRTQMEDTFEVVVAGRGDAPVMLTCEHASEHVPKPWSWHPDDAWLRGTHWSHDIGAADLVRDLAARWGATAVLSRFSRLLADPNRPEGHADMFRQEAEGQAVRMNQGLSDEEQERRLSHLYRRYHEAVSTQIRDSAPEVLFAVHSFTPVYEGRPRHLEIGVLYDLEEELANHVKDHLAAAGMEVALNEPYSGKLGLIYSADRHAREHASKAVEIEVRQDLIVDDAFRQRLVDALTDALMPQKHG